MTEIEKKAEEYFKNNIGVLDSHNLYPSNNEKLLKQSYIDGYEQGQTDFDETVTKLLNSYGVTFIDTNSIGGLIGLHELMLDLEKENEMLKNKITELQFDNDCMYDRITELLKQIEKMKCCGNCKNACYSGEEITCRINKPYWEDTSNNCINCDKWELAE